MSGNLGVRAQLAVKWKNQAWTYYTAEKSRSIASIMWNFRNMSQFAFCVIYEWTGKRGHGVPLNDPSHRGRKMFQFGQFYHTDFR